MNKTVNLVHLVGYLGAEPKLKWFDPESCMVRLSVATHSPSFLSEEGRESSGLTTDWHRVLCYNRSLVELTKQMGTGDLVKIDGRLTYAKSFNKTGKVTYHTYVIARHIELLETKPEPVAETPEETLGRLDRYGRYFETLQEDKDGLPF